MKRFRVQCLLKWMGIGLCIGIGTAWGTAWIWQIRYYGGTWGLEFNHGLAGCWTSTVSFPKNLVVEKAGGQQQWWPQHVQFGPVSGLYVPLWMLLLPTAVATVFLFWCDRRPPKGHCQACGYDLAGNTSGVCPECGERI
jgi:hypothetical protein